MISEKHGLNGIIEKRESTIITIKSLTYITRSTNKNKRLKTYRVWQSSVLCQTHELVSYTCLCSCQQKPDAFPLQSQFYRWQPPWLQPGKWTTNSLSMATSMTSTWKMDNKLNCISHCRASSVDGNLHDFNLDNGQQTQLHISAIFITKQQQRKNNRQTML